MLFLTICIATVLIQPVKLIDKTPKTSDKYGPFTVKSTDPEVCRGPKTIDQAQLSCKLKTFPDGVIIGTFEYIVTDTSKFAEIKIMVYNMKNGKKTLMFNYKLTDPCKHYAVGSILSVHLKAEKCVVKPGTYNFKLNITDNVEKFYGKSFFYGDYYFKVIALSKSGNLGCLMMHHTFLKKD